MADTYGLKNRDKAKFLSNQEKTAIGNKSISGLLGDAAMFGNGFMPVTGDIQSGLLAANDLKQGNYGSAALNGVGLLPFIPSMAGVIKGRNMEDVIGGFESLAKSGSLKQAKSRAQELEDLVKGRSKFAEVKLNWDDPKTYDFADELKAKGFDSTIDKNGTTIFHKPNENINGVLNASNPYEYGKAYGYNENDIAHFYTQRFGSDAEKIFNKDKSSFGLLGQ